MALWKLLTLSSNLIEVPRFPKQKAYDRPEQMTTKYNKKHEL